MHSENIATYVGLGCTSIISGIAGTLRKHSFLLRGYPAVVCAILSTYSDEYKIPESLTDRAKMIIGT